MRSGWPVGILLGALLTSALTGGAPAAETSQEARPNSIRFVDYALLPAGGALVRVVFTQAPLAPTSVMVIYHPTHRIAFDFPGTVSAVGKRFIEIGQRGLHSIQVVQSGTRTRLVLNLDRPFLFDTVLEGKALLIALRRPYSASVRDAAGWPQLDRRLVLTLH